MEANMAFFTENVRMNENVLQCCREFRVAKVVSCLSTCIFPDKPVELLDESMLHEGLPHDSNMGYAFAKRMIDVHNRLNADSSQVFTSVIPTNIFGPHDNFDLDTGHVIPSLIHKCLLAKRSGTPDHQKASSLHAPCLSSVVPTMARGCSRTPHQTPRARSR